MKKILLSRRFGWTDAVLIALTVGLLIAFLRCYMPVQSAFEDTTEVSFGYIGRSAGDVLYVVDEGHTRLIVFDRSGQELYRIVDPSDDGESVLYIDDLMVDEEDLYLSVSEWNGMLLDRELILRYDLSGTYLDTVAEASYYLEDGLTNKHRFYGLHREGESLVWAECREDEIRMHSWEKDSSESVVGTFAYDNAFNAVSDLAFDGTSIVILNKNGRIERYDDPENPELLYTTAWSGEEDRIPFRIAVQDGSVYFTDIRSASVQLADPENRSSVTLWDWTDSQTVTLSPDGKEMLLVGADGLTICGQETETYLTLQISRELRTQHITYLIVFAFLIVVGLLLLFRVVVFLVGRKTERTSLVSLSVIGVAALACLIISWILIDSFRENYMDKIREQLQSTAYIVAADISEEDMENVKRAEDFDSEAYAHLCSAMERCFPLSVDFFRTTYCNILRLDEAGESGFGIAYLDQSIGVYFPLDEVETEEVVRVYHTKASVWNDEVLDVSGTYLSVKTPIVNKENVVVGAVAVGADTSVVQDMIQSMERRVFLSTVLILLLFWIVSTEIIAFVSQRGSYRALEQKNAKPVPMHLIRLLVFAVFAAYNMSSSFLPVYVLKHAEFISEKWQQLAASLPITVNIFVMGIMSLFCAKAVRRLGVVKVFVISMAFSICGNLLVFLARGYAGIFLGLALDGIGVGLITNAIYVALTYLPDEHTRQNGFSAYNAASLSGINFGMILGSILAVNIGQKNVFQVVVYLWVVLVALGGLLAKRLNSILSFRSDDTEEEKGVISTGRFLSSKPIWSFIVLIQNPWILFNSFVFYFVPILCENMGYQETIASILIMLYSQTAAILSGVMPDRMEKLMGEHAIYPALLLNVAAVAVFILTWNTTGLVIALLLLGLSASFAKPTQQALFLRQKASRLLGEDRAMGIYNFSENIGESLGPVILGSLLIGPTVWVWGFLWLVTALGGTHFAINRRGMAKHEK